MVTVIWLMVSLWFLSHIGRATAVASPYVDKKHRQAMYQMTVTMYYILSYLKTGFLGQFFYDISLKFCCIWPFCTTNGDDIRSLHENFWYCIFSPFRTFWANLSKKKFVGKFWYYDTVLISLILRLCEHSKGMINYFLFLCVGGAVKIFPYVSKFPFLLTPGRSIKIIGP